MAHRVAGKVDRLYVEAGSCFIRLKGIADLPLDGLFELHQSHQNYNALYSLALASAINGYTLQIRTAGEIDPSHYAPVRYMVVDW
jgi:hypothetical protein